MYNIILVRDDCTQCGLMSIQPAIYGKVQVAPGLFTLPFIPTTVTVKCFTDFLREYSKSYNRCGSLSCFYFANVS